MKTINAVAMALLLGLLGYVLGQGERVIVVKSERQVSCKPEVTRT